ncbi:MAG TPA: N-formylglutamate amidohydrolase [Kofleriaceae bacterium]|nr:N-formylglutamate amidohydrolase [Kofleriaceae bacterium]
MIGLVLSCEHASWTLPPGVDLGVPPDVLRSQASWDHGAYEIAQRLGDDVGLPVHAGLFSRMFVDLNRAADHPNVVPTVSYGAEVPGNAHLTPGDRAARLAAFHAPYWSAVRLDVAARLRDRGAVLHLSTHSFDPALDLANRVFDLGVLYDPAHAFEADLAERLLFQLRRAGIEVRANQPYSGVGPAICTSLRQELAGARYAGIQLEASYAVTHAAGGCARIAAAIAPFLESLGGGHSDDQNV